MLASVHYVYYGDVDRIFVGLSWELYWQSYQATWAMADNKKTKGLRAPSLSLSFFTVLYWVSARRQSQWYSQNLCRPFLQPVRLLYLHYAAQFFLHARSVILRVCAIPSIESTDSMINGMGLRVGSGNQPGNKAKLHKYKLLDAIRVCWSIHEVRLRLEASFSYS